MKTENYPGLGFIPSEDDQTKEDMIQERQLRREISGLMQRIRLGSDHQSREENDQATTNISG